MKDNWRNLRDCFGSSKHWLFYYIGNVGCIQLNRRLWTSELHDLADIALICILLATWSRKQESNQIGDIFICYWSINVSSDWYIFQNCSFHGFVYMEDQSTNQSEQLYFVIMTILKFKFNNSKKYTAARDKGHWVNWKLWRCRFEKYHLHPNYVNIESIWKNVVSDNIYSIIVV